MLIWVPPNGREGDALILFPSPLQISFVVSLSALQPLSSRSVLVVSLCSAVGPLHSPYVQRTKMSCALGCVTDCLFPFPSVGTCPSLSPSPCPDLLLF